VPVLLPFLASRIPARNLPELLYVPGVEAPRDLGDIALILDCEPALFIYRQSFQSPGDACQSARIGVMGVLNRADAQVFTHEETIADRVSGCAAAIHSNQIDPGSLWLWCGDTQSTLAPLLQPSGDPNIAAQDRFGCLHEFWRVTNSHDIQRLQRSLTAEPLYLADGHHRYAAGWNLATIQIRTPGLRMRPGSRPVPDIDALERNARKGILLPPKTTDFWPKLAAGLVLYRHQNDHATPPTAHRLGVR